MTETLNRFWLSVSLESLLSASLIFMWAATTEMLALGWEPDPGSPLRGGVSAPDGGGHLAPQLYRAHTPESPLGFTETV